MHWSPQRSWSPASSAEVPQAAPQLLQTRLCWVKSRALWERAEHPAQEALWLAKHTAPLRKPCAIQGPGSPHSMQQHLGYTQAAGVRYYGAGAQQPKCLANKLPFIKCRISKLGCLWQWKCQKGMRYSYNEQVSAQPAENKVRTVPAPPSLETSVHDLFFSHVFSSVTPVRISSCRTNTHTEYATQQLYKLNWAL